MEDIFTAAVNTKDALLLSALCCVVGVPSGRGVEGAGHKPHRGRSQEADPDHLHLGTK